MIDEEEDHGARAKAWQGAGTALACRGANAGQE